MQIPGLSFEVLLNEEIVLASPKAHQLTSAGKTIMSRQFRDETFSVTLSGSNGRL